MEIYYIESIIAEIAKGIERLLEQKVITREKKVLLYGLERYAFAMRTILSNLGYHNIDGYISDDEALVVQYKFQIKNFACRFLNKEEDIINVWTTDERLGTFDKEVIILMVAKERGREKAKLEALGYKENIHFYTICDFRDKQLMEFFKKRVPMTTAEIKQTEKEILAFIDIFCRENNLRYWVCGGTLLGTIRHKGFIPWDDDIDIFLPWKDYQSFVKIFRETEHFSIMGFGTDRAVHFPDLLAKVVDRRTIVNEDIGTLRKITPLWVDVFPLIGLPDNDKERHKFFMKYKELNRQIWQEFYSTNGNTDIFLKWSHKRKEFLCQYDFDQASYVGVLGTRYEERDCTTRQVYGKTLRMRFEDIDVNVPIGYKEYLDNLYGSDWMRLPSENKRKTYHDMNAYWNREKHFVRS